ncbi:MAG: RsiV family protein [Chlorobi bacterium]|nr:RsiV family protein [Chlorobiota bacterium]MCI0716514.1 RsiV family protein [Chlorobiota bacterium]
MKTKLLIFSALLLTVNFFAQNYKISHKAITDKNSKLKYEFSISYPLIKDFKEHITSMSLFNRFITNKAEGIRVTFNVWMKDWDTTTTNHEMGSFYEAGDSVFYASNGLISVLFYELWYFSGAAHPNNSNFSINYDLENHKELGLGDLLSSGWGGKISEICIRELDELKKEHGIEPEDWLKDGAGPSAENFKVFNITKKGLVITFPTYQVGPYVEGPSEVFIAYDEIRSLIMPGSILAFVK